jgi:hypothetical protein
MFSNNEIKTEIEFYGICKTIEILNKQLEQFISETEYCHIDEITRIVLLIIELNKKIDNKNKCFLTVKNNDKE